MNCKYIGLCGSCTIGVMNYDAQLEYKVDKVRQNFNAKPEIFKSPSEKFRSKAEFKIFKDGSSVSYAMRSGKDFIKIDSCEIVSHNIKILAPKVLNAIAINRALKEKAFEAHFLDGDKLLISLIYHKKLGADWEIEAQKLAIELNVNIVGRSRGQKIVIGDDFIETQIAGFKYRLSENGFSQPNRYINAEMLNWTINASKDVGGDLLEAYCGSGNFTIALAQNFGKVLATEISKPTIALAEHNAKINDLENIKFARLSGEELASALNKERAFNRLSGVNLDEYDFKAIFVDPPRAGLDDAARKFTQKWDTIIYISCSPQTLRRDLDELEKTHELTKLAFFDQFPFTEHLECGALLQRKNNYNTPRNSNDFF